MMSFVSDEVSTSIRKCLRRSDFENTVATVDVPPLNLKPRNRLYDRLCLTPNCVVCPTNREGDCTITGVVYKIICNSCGDEYIGETARPLHVRLKEHIDGKSRSRTSTALGAHRVQKHDGDDFEIRVEVLAQESQLFARKSLEAFWIQFIHPKMNRKECL